MFLHVCRLVHAYAYDFDPRAAVIAMKGGARWQEKRESFLTATGTEMKDSEIVEMWRSSGQVASARGTLLHWHAEMHLNGRTVEHPQSPEFGMFLAILRVLQGWGLRVFRTELSMFHCGLCLAGFFVCCFSVHVRPLLYRTSISRCRNAYFVWQARRTPFS